MNKSFPIWGNHLEVRLHNVRIDSKHEFQLETLAKNWIFCLLCTKALDCLYFEYLQKSKEKESFGPIRCPFKNFLVLFFTFVTWRLTLLFGKTTSFADTNVDSRCIVIQQFSAGIIIPCWPESTSIIDFLCTSRLVKEVRCLLTQEAKSYCPWPM